MVLEQDKDARYGPSTDDAWNLQIDQTFCGDLQQCLDREWLVTNGIGGYAAGSLPGATTCSYHGLLVAALHPPVAYRLSGQIRQRDHYAQWTGA